MRREVLEQGAAPLEHRVPPVGLPGAQRGGVAGGAPLRLERGRSREPGARAAVIRVVLGISQSSTAMPSTSESQ